MNAEIAHYSATLRHERFAILVDPNRLTPDLAAQVFAACSTLWGGRYHPVVPTDGRRLANGWDDLVRSVDPDCIISLAQLDDDLIWWLHREVGPARIVVQDCHDRLDHRHLDGLGLMDIPLYLKENFRGMDPLEFLHLQGTAGAKSLFAALNFGMIAPSPFEDRDFDGMHPLRIELESSDASGILDALLEKGHLRIAPKDLSSVEATAPCSFRGLDPSEFQLIVGSEATDILYGWNWALVTTGSHPLGPQCLTRSRALWLPAGVDSDFELLRRVGSFVHKQLSYTQSGRLTVLSGSVELDTLRAIGSSIKDGFPAWSGIHIRDPRRLEPGVFPCPEVADTSVFFARDLERLPLEGGRGVFSAPVPKFVRDLSRCGSYMVDLDLTCLYEPNDTYQPARRWVLPRSTLVSTEFVAERRSRVISDGRLAIEVDLTNARVPVRIPSPASLFNSLLEQRPKLGCDLNLEPERTAFASPRPSAEGKRLETVIRLFGGLGDVTQVLNDPFWYAALGCMSGAQHRGEQAKEHRIGRVKQALDDALSTGLRITPDERDDLDVIAVKIAEKLEPGVDPQWRPSLACLKGTFKRLQGEAIRDDPEHSYWSARSSFDEWEEDTLGRMLETGILAQGVEIPCPRCETTNWFLVDQISVSLPCSGCQITYPIPITPINWQFQLSEVVARALRDRGTVASLRALSALLSRSRLCFLHSPCLDIQRAGKTERLTDLDLVVLLDGRFLIGEVKASVKGFSAGDVKALGVVAKEVLPNGVLLAAPEAPSEDWEPVRAMARALRRELLRQGVSVSLLRVVDWSHGELETVE